MKNILSVAQAKGGCGKTTSTHAIASILSKDRRVLVIDMDPQQSQSLALLNEWSGTIYDVLARGKSIGEVIIPALQAYGPNLYVIPASPLLSNLDTETSARFDRQYLLKDSLESLQDFDWVIIDCPSSQGILTVAPLTTATYVNTPVSTDPLCFEQVSRFAETITLVRKRFNPDLRWLPLLPSIHDQRNCLDREVLSAMRDRYDVFQTVIRRSVRIKEALAAQVPCNLPDFIQLVEEIKNETKTI